jgi:hypothetical protein
MRSIENPGRQRGGTPEHQSFGEGYGNGPRLPQDWAGPAPVVLLGGVIGVAAGLSLSLRLSLQETNKRTRLLDSLPSGGLPSEP